MAHSFLYFFPQKSDRITPDTLANLGFGYLLGEGITMKGYSSGGPTKSGGTLVAFGTSDLNIAYSPEQTWRKIPKTDAWIGHNGELPTPADLMRRDIVNGRSIDGWIIPVIAVSQKGYEFTELPKSMTLDDDGNWVFGDVQPKYSAIFQRGKELFEFFSKAAAGSDEVEGEVEVDDQVIADSLCDAVSINYRVSKIECALLHLMDDGIRDRLLNAMLGLTLIEDQKKTDEPLSY